MTSEQQSLCPVCGGSGQLNSFKGESCFLLTEEECPLCCGTGLVLKEEQQDKERNDLQDKP